MNKKTCFPVYFLVVILIVTSMSCSFSGGESEQADTEQNIIPVDTSTPSASLPTSDSIAATNLPTTSPVSPIGVTWQWTVKTGKLRFFGVSSDGKIYGVSENLYAILGSNGEVLQTNDVSLGRCIRDNFSGGFGTMTLNNWFVFEADGTFHTISNSYCIISPDNPPSIEENQDNYLFSPYSDGVKIINLPPIPDGFEDFRNGYYFGDNRRKNLNAYVNKSERKIAYFDRNGEIRVFDLPADFDLENHPREFSMIIMPWDDVYCSYPAYDALGNNLGNKKCIFDRNGNFNYLSKFPSPFFLESSTTNSLSDMIFLPEIERVYLYSLPKHTLSVYDLNLSFLEEYQLPESFPRIDSRKELFVGYDGAVYVYDTEFLDETISTYVTALSKYLLPDRSVSIQPQPTVAALNDDGLLSQILNRGTIVIATDPNYYPQSQVNISGERSKNTKCANDQLTAGELLGFDIDVAITISLRLGVEPCFVAPSWDHIVAGTWGDQWDISVGSMVITPEREQVLFFATPYYFDSDGNPMGIAIDKASSLPVESLVKVVDQIVKDMHLDGTLSEYSYKWYEKDVTK